MRLYIKSVAFCLLVGGFTIYNIMVDSSAITATIRNVRTLTENNDKHRIEIDPHYIPRLLEGGGCPEPADPHVLALPYAIGIMYLLLSLAILADDFFCPTLDIIAGYMKLSPDVAGATLQAAGGSAPELFTSAVGTFLRSDVGFGAIVGSAVFNILFVVGACILMTPIPMKVIMASMKIISYLSELILDLAPTRKLHWCYPPHTYSISTDPLSHSLSVPFLSSFSHSFSHTLSHSQYIFSIRSLRPSPFNLLPSNSLTHSFPPPPPPPIPLSTSSQLAVALVSIAT